MPRTSRDTAARLRDSSAASRAWITLSSASASFAPEEEEEEEAACAAEGSWGWSSVDMCAPRLESLPLLSRKLNRDKLRMY